MFQKQGQGLPAGGGLIEGTEGQRDPGDLLQDVPAGDLLVIRD